MFCFESNFNFAPSAFAVSAAYDKYYFKGTPSPAKLHLLIFIFIFTPWKIQLFCSLQITFHLFNFGSADPKYHTLCYWLLQDIRLVTSCFIIVLLIC